MTFAVERATAGNGVSQPAQLKIGTYSGTLNAAIPANTCPAGDYPILTYASLAGDFAKAERPVKTE